MSNVYRNETEVTLNGTVYTLRPTFNCLADIESFAGKSIFKVVADISEGNLTVKLAFNILESGIKAAGGEVDATKLKRDMAEGSLNETLLAASTFLVNAVKAGDNIKKN